MKPVLRRGPRLASEPATRYSLNNLALFSTMTFFATFTTCDDTTINSSSIKEPARSGALETKCMAYGATVYVSDCTEDGEVRHSV